MKWFVSFAVATILALSPIAASAFDTAKAQEIATWAGCDATVYYQEADDPNGFFGVNFFTGEQAIVIVGTDKYPEEWGWGVFLHELAHCVQYKNGSMAGRTPVEIEWEADALGAEYALSLGYDLYGNANFLAHVRHEYGYEGDWAHGSVVDRIHHIWEYVQWLFRARSVEAA